MVEVSFGEWLKRQRKALDLTQEQLARRISCSTSALRKIEAEQRRPSEQIVEQLADVFHIPSTERASFLRFARGNWEAAPVRGIEEDAPWHALQPHPYERESESPSLPSGTVTFLFTDIEGSTKLAQEHTNELHALLARHKEILKQAIETHHGFVFQIVGDSFSAAFDTAMNALRAASEAQRLLQIEAWSPALIKVRMGIHTGAAQLAEDSSVEGPYSGYATLALTQRIMSAAHGGQILLSQASEFLLRGHLPNDISLLDLGEHKFKDIFQPVRVFQVLAPDLQKEFPALNALDVLPNNLPTQLTSFIGRERELAEVKQLLSNTRLLTLIGPGGTGKTRLSLQTAQEVLPQFTNGVWLVELAPLTDPALIPQTIASVFELREAPNVPLVDIIANYLRLRQLLLILDNCEHLIAACAKLSADLLQVCPQLKIIASSREALGIIGETLYRVPSLSLPDPARVTPEAIADYESVQLFVDRARAVKSQFALTDSNAPYVTQICHRLDGIPLALELAAARLAVFSAEEIASRLDNCFRLLTGGSRTALERHQTLQALIDWSYDLLSDDERRLFRRLSVFAGGWTFEAAEAVCSDLDVLNLLTQLVNKSLVMVDADAQAEATRYRLPETIRQYARDKLLESGESELARDRHLDFFLGFAERAEPKLRGAEQLAWLDRVETDHDNLRTALSWSLESGKSEHALRLSGALGQFWVFRGYWSESQRWLEDALALSESEQSKKAEAGNYIPTHTEKAQRAKALFGVTWPQLTTMNLKNAHKTAEESLRLWRELGDKWWMAVALEHIGFILILEGDVQTSRACLEEAVSLAREVEDPWPLAVCLNRLGEHLKGRDMVEARRILEEGVAVARRVGDKSVLSYGLRELGSVYSVEGNLTDALHVTEEALAEARLIGSIFNVLAALFQLVVVSCLQNDPAKAKDYCFELWALARDTGVGLWAGLALTAFGLAALFGGESQRGVRLLAALQAALGQHGIKFPEGDPTTMVVGGALERARAQLGPAAFEAAQIEGRQMTMEQALALATENEGDDSQLPKDGLGSSSDA